MSVLTITKENYETEVLQSKVPVLLDFWAPWCGPCRTLGPIVDDLAQEAGNFKIGKVNVDEQQDLARKFRVMSVPTVAVIKDGSVTKRAVGVQPKEQLLAMVNG